MPKVNSQYTLLNAVTSSGAGTAYNIANAESFNVQVSLSGNTGAVTVQVQGSVDGTNYGNIDSTTTAGDGADYFVGQSLMPYKTIRAATVTHTSTATLVTAVLRLQGEGA